jgi:hypothetical protein
MEESTKSEKHAGGLEAQCGAGGYSVYLLHLDGVRTVTNQGDLSPRNTESSSSISEERGVDGYKVGVTQGLPLNCTRHAIVKLVYDPRGGALENPVRPQIAAVLSDERSPVSARRQRRHESVQPGVKGVYNIEVLSPTHDKASARCDVKWQLCFRHKRAEVLEQWKPAQVRKEQPLDPVAGSTLPQHSHSWLGRHHRHSMASAHESLGKGAIAEVIPNLKEATDDK